MPQAATFTDAHGVAVTYHRWDPSGSPRAVVLIAHGASEYGARYDRFASFLTSNGFVAYAQDHRGHGETGKANGVGITGPGGWDAIVEDQLEMVRLARADHPGLKVALFAHSMGSMMAQRFVQLHGDEIDALVLSGSLGSLDGLDGIIEMLAPAVAEAGDSPFPLSGGFNEQFSEKRTDYDWLSRDQAEVDKYIADPFCGDNNPLTLRFALEMMQLLQTTWKPENEANVPDIPTLFITGALDPVGQNGATVRDLEARYKAAGVTDLTALYYPEARHELLNETNRDDVQNDVLGWLNRVVG
ncbi:MAG: lysophospholipase [Acidimicrobiales bacterium]|nr:lysophospholipase [Acidimicrobiales bacterium]